MTGNIGNHAGYGWEKALETALEVRDAYTRHHSTRVCALCQDMGHNCSLDSDSLATLCLASALHDIGKLGIPDTVLFKPGKLNQDEWQKMKTHSALGEGIIRSLELENSDAVACAIRHHHEYYNGDGYPDALAGEQIPLHARIIAIADSYDAMTTRRTYAEARSHRETMAIIDSEREVKLDPYFVRIFSHIIEQSEYRAD